MFAVLITAAAGAAMCLALGLVLRLSGRLGAADRHESLTLAVALALLMPLLVLAMPARLRRRAQASPRDQDVVISADVVVPMVTGVLRPSIVLPPDALAWPAEDLALALLHERAHVARQDVAKQRAASIVCALYWFNPLAWIVASDREHAVDALVLQGGARASAYAALLVRVAVRADEATLLEAFHTPAVGRADLTRRVEAVLKTPQPRASRLRRVCLASALIGAAFAAACSQGPTPTPTPTLTAARSADAPCTEGKDTPSAALLEHALGGATTLDDAKQLATEQSLDAWLAAEPSILWPRSRGCGWRARRGRPISVMTSRVRRSSASSRPRLRATWCWSPRRRRTAAAARPPPRASRPSSRAPSGDVGYLHVGDQVHSLLGRRKAADEG